MNIAFVCAYFDGPELDSITTSFYEELAKAQHHGDNRVTIITLTDGEASDQDWCGIRHVRLKFDRQRYRALESIGFAPALSWNLARAMDLYRQGAPVVHAVGAEIIQCTKAIDAVGWLAYESLPVAVLSVTPQFEIMRHDFDRQYNRFDTELVTLLEIMSMQAASVVASPSRELREIIATTAGIDLARIAEYLVPFAACLERDRESAASGTSPVDPRKIVYMGGLERYKGVDVLVESLLPLRERMSQFHLVIAGGSPALIGQDSLVSVLKARLQELGLTDFVEFLPALSRPERRTLVRSAAAVVFPFRYCGCMSHVLEAMSDGAAVVASRVGSIGERLTHLLNAFLVRADDPANLADGIEQILLDQDLRNRLQSGARELVERQYGASQARDLLAALNSRVVSEFAAAQCRAVKIGLGRLLAAAEDYCRHGYLDRVLEEKYSEGARSAWSEGYESGRVAAAGPAPGHARVLAEIMQGWLKTGRR